MSEGEHRIPPDIRQVIAMGMDAARFLDSTVGRYLVMRSEQKVLEALEGMKTVDPEDAKAVRALQTEIKVGEAIQYWIAEAINEGANAEQAFVSQQE